MEVPTILKTKLTSALDRKEKKQSSVTLWALLECVAGLDDFNIDINTEIIN